MRLCVRAAAQLRRVCALGGNRLSSFWRSEEKRNEMNVCGQDCNAYVIQFAVERTGGKWSM